MGNWRMGLGSDRASVCSCSAFHIERFSVESNGRLSVTPSACKTCRANQHGREALTSLMGNACLDVWRVEEKKKLA